MNPYLEVNILGTSNNKWAVTILELRKGTKVTE